MTRLQTFALALTASTFLFPRPAFAQDRNDPWALAKVHFGRIALTPTAGLTNIGFDNNVFNEPTASQPKSDFTSTIQGKTDLWLHLKRSLFAASVTEDFVYYNKYASQRSINGLYKVGLTVPLNRITFKTNVAYTKAKDRPGFEIDARLPRSEANYDAAVEFRVSAKSFGGVRITQQAVSFDEGDIFAGTNIRDELTRDVRSQALTLRYRLTPLTTLTFEAGTQHDHFRFNSLRDSDSTKVIVGALFDQFALLKGSARFGYRSFTPAVAGLPDFKGVTAAIDLTYVARGATKVMFAGARDINYSFEINQPYYVQTGATISLMQQVSRSIDVLGRIGHQRLAYRDRLVETIRPISRTDTVHTYQVGAGYRLGRTLRLGFNLDKQDRRSPLVDRTFGSLRFGAAVTYEF